MKKFAFFLVAIALLSCYQESHDALPKPELTAETLARAIDLNKISSKTVRRDDAVLKIYYFKFDIVDPSVAVPQDMFYRGKFLADDGAGHDVKAGDGVYTLIEPFILSTTTVPGEEEVYFEKYRSPDVQNRTNDFYLKCKFDLALPGQKCLAYDCPAKSLLGGKTIFCFCVSDCEICFGDCKK